MKPPVEVFSATDPIYVANRQVRYYLEYRGKRSQQLTEYAPVLAWAEAICAEHETCLVDRSDKGSGFLRAMLDRL